MKVYLRTLTILISIDVSQLRDMEKACAEFITLQTEENGCLIYLWEKKIASVYMQSP